MKKCTERFPGLKTDCQDLGISNFCDEQQICETFDVAIFIGCVRLLKQSSVVLGGGRGDEETSILDLQEYT